MEAEIHTLFSSSYYEISDFKCKCLECSKSQKEYQEAFSISFVKKGNFYFNVFRETLDAFNGHILINKPDYEYSVTHVANMPDECTILTFKNNFYEKIKDEFYLENSWFFANKNIQSVLLKTSPELEYLHFTILKNLKENTYERLHIEIIIVEILEEILQQVSVYKPNIVMLSSLKKNHLKTIEHAKEYLNKNFTNDISLFDLADYCLVSPFHFSRIFKTFTDTSPNLFLQNMRLKHAELLLKTTNSSITDIAFLSGFNSIDYFSSAFKTKYKIAPSQYRSNHLI